MGSGHSSDKLHCNRYLNGQGPPSLKQQADQQVNGKCGLDSCQPEGRMTWVVLHTHLPAFPNENTVQINYTFTHGVQMDKHPHPGRPFAAQRLCSYLPDNREGRRVLKLLDKGFSQQLLFTITTNNNGEDVITNSIPLRIQVEGESTGDVYPDSGYLKTVRKLLRDEGIQ